MKHEFRGLVRGRSRRSLSHGTCHGRTCSNNIIGKKILILGVEARTVKVSDKGQVAIPVEIRKAMGLRKGSELLLLYDAEKLLAIRADQAAEALLRVFDDLVRASAKVAGDLWGNEADEVWNDL